LPEKQPEYRDYKPLPGSEQSVKQGEPREKPEEIARIAEIAKNCQD
jgi:hypothetical protein